MKLLGRQGEDLAASFYIKQGYKPVERNYSIPYGKQTGEIDLIFVRQKELVFVEVKTRTSGKFGTPFEAVDTSKQRKLVHTAKLFLQLHPKWQGFSYRIDVAAVDIDNPSNPVIILPNAIEDID